MEANDFTYTVSDGYINALTDAEFEIRRVENMIDSLQYAIRYKNSNQILDYSQTPGHRQFFKSANYFKPFDPSAVRSVGGFDINLIANDTLIFDYTILNADNVQTGEEIFLIRSDDNNLCI